MPLPGTYFLQNLVRSRSLLYQLVRRDFEQRYVGSVVGWLWGIIHPLVLLAVYTFVFVYAFGMRLPQGEVTDSYPLFLFAGMLPWLLFSETLQRSASSLVDYSSLIKKTVFPAEIVPLSIFLSTLISHLLALVLLIGIVGFRDHHLSPALLLLPVYFLVGVWNFPREHIELSRIDDVKSLGLVVLPVSMTHNIHGPEIDEHQIKALSQ